MDNLYSKKPSDDAPPPIQINTITEYTVELSSHEAACQPYPNLQTLDATLQRRTNQVINTLADGVGVRSVSLDLPSEVTGSLLERNEEVVKVIEGMDYIRKNQELVELVKEYFDSNRQTLDFCTALEECLKRARNSQSIIHVALQQFEEDQKDGVDGKKYLRTLQELKNFKEAGDPFGNEFSLLFESVKIKQKSMSEKLVHMMEKLDKRSKSVKKWRTVSNIIFVAVFASVLIFSVVAAAIAAPPFVTALAGALAVPVGSMGTWINSLWKGYENAMKGQRVMVLTIKFLVAISDFNNIRALVPRLQIEIESLLQNAHLALREEDAVKLVIDEIKKNLSVFVETIEHLGKHADNCSRDTRQAETVILQRIMNPPNS